MCQPVGEQASSSHGWLQGPGCPKAVANLLVSGVKSWGNWLRGPKCFGFGISLMVGRARDQVVPELVLAHWLVGLCPGPASRLASGVSVLIIWWMVPGSGANKTEDFRF